MGDATLGASRAAALRLAAVRDPRPGAACRAAGCTGPPAKRATLGCGGSPARGLCDVTNPQNMDPPNVVVWPPPRGWSNAPAQG